MQSHLHGLNVLQKISLSLMAVLVLLTFIGANIHAIFWQSSEWLVSTILPAVVVDLTNQERSEISAAPLTRSAVLDKAAELKAKHMATNQYFAHYSPEGVSPWYWFDQVGYVYAHAGENLAIHFTDSSEVVDAWMKSPTHRENIVGRQYTEIGVGTAKGTYEGYDTIYVVQLFGAPAATPAPTSLPKKPVEKVVEETAPLLVVEEPSELVTAPALVEEVPAEPVAAVLPAETEAMPHPEPITLEVPVEPLPEAAPPTELAAESSVLETESEIDPATFAAVSAAEGPEVVFVESSMVATSSGLAVAQVTTERSAERYHLIPSFATQPNSLLQLVYFVIGTLVVLMLFTSIVLEARRFRVTQMLYGFALLGGMGTLWYMHLLLTSGAVVA